MAVFPLMTAASARRYEYEPNDEMFNTLNIDAAPEALVSEGTHLALEYMRLAESVATDATTFIPMLDASDFPRLLDRAIAAVDPNNRNETRESFLYGHDFALDDGGGNGGNQDEPLDGPGDLDLALGARELRAIEVGAGRV